MLRVSMLLAAAAAALADSNPLVLTLTPTGGYSLSTPAWPALALQGAPLRVQQQGAWLSTADGSLVSLGQRVDGSGADAWGDYASSSFSYAAAAAPSAPLVLTTFRVYSNTSAVVFEASFPGGLATGQTGTDNKNGVVATFPSWELPPASTPLGFFQFAGAFINQGLAGPAMGPFSVPGKALASGLAGGPLVLLDATAAASLVLSAASEYMAVSGAVLNASEMAFGPLGSAQSLPAGYAYSVVAFYGVGVNYNVQAFGAAMLRKHGKEHGLSKLDYTNTNLIYNTDHGAFYYYNTADFPNYSEVLDAVYNYSVTAGIPYRGVLLDSWWYFKGVGGGVKNWTATPTTFTGGNAGIRALVDRTGWKVTAHNRYWSANTDYASANGGAWDFFVDAAGQGSMAVPLQQEFWGWLLSSSVTEWGLTTYEQDWLYNELMGVEALLTNVTLGRQWLLQMGAGAEAAGVSIQLCMAYPRHALTTLEMPTATQIRASDDHVPGAGARGGDSTVQWKLGYSSMLAWALGLAPFKDNYWSSAQQPGSSCGANASEVTPALHNAASTFSAGPVTPGDGVGMSDVAQIMRACAASGRLLHPSRPMTAIDAQVVGDVFGAAAGRPAGDVYATYTYLSGLVFGHALAANLQQPYSLTPADLAAISSDIALRTAAPLATTATATLAYALDADSLAADTLTVQPFGDSSPYAFKACGLPDFQVVHTTPLFANGWALLGDLRKWVPVAEARFSDLQVSSTALSVAVSGQEGEVVPVAFYNAASAQTSTVLCTLPPSGRATASAPGLTCLDE